MWFWIIPDLITISALLFRVVTSPQAKAAIAKAHRGNPFHPGWEIAVHPEYKTPPSLYEWCKQELEASRKNYLVSSFDELMFMYSYKPFEESEWCNKNALSYCKNVDKFVDTGETSYLDEATKLIETTGLHEQYTNHHWPTT